MPVYLCQPGSTASEPWRHGIQVYVAPFAMDDVPAISTTGRDTAADHNTADEPSQWTDTNEARDQEGSFTGGDTVASQTHGSFTIARTATASGGPRATATSGTPIRRVRHAEVVLVDDVCIAYDRYWLRLRWPGHKGGFAGYIALGRVSEETYWIKNKAIFSTKPLGTFLPAH